MLVLFARDMRVNRRPLCDLPRMSTTAIRSFFTAAIIHASATHTTVDEATVRLLFVSHTVPSERSRDAVAGGMQRSALEAMAALDAHPDITLFPLVLTSSPASTPIRLIPFLAGLLWRLPRRAAATGSQIVLFSSMVTATVAWPLRGVLRRRGVRLAAVAHGHDVTWASGVYQWALPRIFAALDHVLPVSEATAAACLARGASRAQIRVIANGVDLTRFRPPTDRVRSRALFADAFGIAVPPGRGALILCWVGRAVPRKGIRWFISEVMPRLPAGVQLWMAGTGPETAGIRSAIVAGGMERRVHQLGRVSETQLAELYRAADLFVMPNVPIRDDPEGFGLVMLEAGASGLPTVAARVDGIPDVIREGENGHLLEPADPAAFAARIVAYERDRASLDEAGARAARFTMARCGWPLVAAAYLDALRPVSAEVSPAVATDPLVVRT